MCCSNKTGSTTDIRLADSMFHWLLVCVVVRSTTRRYEKAVKVLSYVGKNSLGYYWLNGYVLVLVRVLVVTIMGVTFGPAVVLTVFVLCAVIETLIIFIIKKMPKVGILIGV